MSADVMARFLDRLASRDCNPAPSGGGYRALCPAHNDVNPSLSVTYVDGKLLVKCFGGCDTEDVLRALGSSWPDVFEQRDAPKHGPNDARWTEVASYVYEDERGEPLFRIRRLERIQSGRRVKRFVQGRYIGNGNFAEAPLTMKGVRRVLFRLPEVRSAVRAGKEVWILEGEKAVLCAERLGLVATTVPGGANKPWLGEYSEVLRGATVRILPDNDAPGYKHARKVADALHGVTAEVRIVELPNLPPKGDIIEFVEQGGTREQLLDIAQRTPPYSARLNAVERSANTTGTSDGDITVIRLDEVEPKPVEWLWQGRLPLGKLVILDGDPGLGKSHLTIAIAAAVTTGRPLPGQGPTEPGNVVFLALEDDPADTLRPRAEAAGADLSRIFIVPGLVENGVERPLGLPDDAAELRKVVEEHNAKLVVIDPIVTHLSESADAYKDHSVRRALQPVATLAQDRNCLVMGVRHLKKAHNGNALLAGGGSIGIAGIARLVLIVTPDPDNPDERVLAVAKSNLSKFPPSLRFKIEESERGSRVVWLGETELNANELLSAGLTPADGGSTGQAVRWLREQLSEGPVTKAKLLELAEPEGINVRTLERAKERLNATSRRRHFGGQAEWFLPESVGTGARNEAATPVSPSSPLPPFPHGGGEDGEDGGDGELGSRAHGAEGQAKAHEPSPRHRSRSEEYL